jgi:hypothetical protein
MVQAGKNPKVSKETYATLRELVEVVRMRQNGDMVMMRMKHRSQNILVQQVADNVVGPNNLLTFGTVYWNTIAACSITYALSQSLPNPRLKQLVRTSLFLLLHFEWRTLTVRSNWQQYEEFAPAAEVVAGLECTGLPRSDNPAGRFFPIIYWGIATACVVMVQLSQQCTSVPPLSTNNHLHRQAGTILRQSTTMSARQTPSWSCKPYHR